ncbi:LysR family transcriptional regulator [Aquabacterium sp. J223]|uniref:LysR family transcriptional regulator n=1 Tax=Aquabacterium sp. J223 TaxID=2898431 RepID=UPI0021ADB99E|nr:LysR family transcriptional regulator [Aquabacterium sp. J223]UUX94469.1 LysR family transcriptional regulator [Aquabacterium sp. J223]
MDVAFDLNLLRVLVALDAARNVTRAAQELDMSQSGFSTALARLRRQVGDPLYVRTSRGMEATPRAAAMVETARAVLAQVQADILEQPVFEPGTARAEFRLAMADVAEIVFLPRLLAHLQTAAPGVTLRSESWARGSLREAMESGKVDLALGYFPDLSSGPFYQQRLLTHTYAAMLRRGHPALRRRLTLATYLELGHAVVASPSRSNELFEQFLEREGVERRIVLRTPHHLSLPVIVEGSDLVASVPLATAARYADAGMVSVARLPFDPPFFPVQQYWHRRSHRDPALRWLQAQVARLFNDERDDWMVMERRLYGRLRPEKP